jgi:hypothetical protein
MAGKTAYDVADSEARLRGVAGKKALWPYCQTATLAPFAILAHALPEAVSAASTIGRRR